MFQAGLRLVELGDKMAARLGADIPLHMQAKAKLVPGCIAVVHVAVELLPALGGGIPTVNVRGTADARVSRCVAILCAGLPSRGRRSSAFA